MMSSSPRSPTKNLGPLQLLLSFLTRVVVSFWKEVARQRQTQKADPLKGKDAFLQRTNQH